MEHKQYGLASTCFFMFLGYFLAGLVSLAMMLFVLPMIDSIISIPYNMTLSLIYFGVSGALADLFYSVWFSKRKRFNPIYNKLKAGYLALVFILFSIVFYVEKASLLGSTLILPIVLIFPLFPLLFFLLLYGSYYAIIVIGSMLLCSFTLYILIKKEWILSLSSFVCLGCAGICLLTYFNSPNYKYRDQNHDFSYMGGFSSTDLSDYTVYSDSNKLVMLDHEPSLIIENPKDMPVLDGAEACYPVYAAVAKNIYRNIDQIELNFKNTSEDIKYGTNENGTIVTFYNTAVGFERLVNGDVDMFFGAKPSASQLEYAKEHNVELVYTPIGKEAFVFFVEKDNPVDSLTEDQIRSIYHGSITNWKEIGGKNEKIVAFQRPERSGSQSMMVHFMGDISLKEPMTYEMESAMMGIITKVAEYENEAGAIGYSFRYFLEGLNEVDNVKMLKINDVYPSNQSIQNGTYPITTSLYCITVKDNDHPNVQNVLDFLLSEDGQYIIEQTGYSPLN